MLLEIQKILKTTRIVPIDVADQEDEEKELKELGWTWLTDPEGRTCYQNVKSGEKTWETLFRLEEVKEQPPEEPNRVILCCSSSQHFSDAVPM